MYQLSHLLTEQRSLIINLLENSLLGAKPPGLRGQSSEAKPEPSKFALENGNLVNDQEGRKRLTALLEKVEGCTVSHVALLVYGSGSYLFSFLQSVVESATRTLIHEGDMVELDPADNCAIGRVRGFLLNDSFMIASWLPNK